MDNTIKKKTVNGLFFKTLERIFLQGVSLIISIILARLLMPEDYGNVALLLVFITILDVFISYGLGAALIQKKDADDLDFSTCFYSSVIFSLVLYFIIFATSPFLASFYGNEKLELMIKIMGIKIIFSGVSSIQNAYIAKNFLFRKSMLASLTSTIISGSIGIYMAYKGYGEWALIVQTLLSSAVLVIATFFLARFKLLFAFSLKRLSGLLRFGWKLMAIGLLNCGYDEIRSLIIGKKYSTSDLAYFDKGRNFPKLISNNINAIIDGVMYSTMSCSQDNVERVRDILSRSIRISLYLLTPMLVGLALVSDELIILLYTSKWADAITYLKIFCAAFVLIPVTTLGTNSLKAIGKGGLLLLLNIVDIVIGVGLVVISSFFGPLYIALSIFAGVIFSVIIRSFVLQKIFNYSLKKQFLDMFLSLMPGILMGVTVFFVSYIPVGLVIKMIIKIAIGVLSFIALSLLFHNDSLLYLIKTAKEKINKNNE